MDHDTDRIDDAVLALLYLTTFEDHGVQRAWKSHDWDALNRLHEKGLIGNPRSKAKSVVLTEEGPLDRESSSSGSSGRLRSRSRRPARSPPTPPRWRRLVAENPPTSRRAAR